MDNNQDNKWELVYSYTRKQALEEGCQHKLEGELAEIARQAYKWPVYVTHGVWVLIEKAVANEKYLNDLKGVVSDIINMSRLTAKPLSETTSEFTVIITGTGRKKHHRMLIKAGPTDIDDPSPCMTIMLPGED